MKKPILSLASAALIAACGTQPHPGTRQNTVATPRSTAQVAYLSNGRGALISIDVQTGKFVANLPDGLHSPDWSRIYALGTSISGSFLEIVATSRSTKYSKDVPIHDASRSDTSYSLDRVSPGAISPDGHWLTVSSASQHGVPRGTTQLAVVETSEPNRVRTFSLGGDFTIDAINNDGSKVYLLEYYLPSDRSTYHVRSFDVAKARLDRGVIVAKGESTAAMVGERISFLASPDGQWLYSLFVGQHGPFVHALNIAQAFAVCIDLPAAPGGSRWQDYGWSIALRPDGSELYAANPAAGQVAAISVDKFKVRSAKFPAVVAQTSLLSRLLGGLVVDASAKELLGMPAATSPDGGLLYVPSAHGVTRIDTRTLKPLTPLAPGLDISSLALSPDAASIYTVDPGVGMLYRVDTASGKFDAIAGVDEASVVLAVVRG